MAFTYSAGRRCQSDTLWIVFLQFSWHVAHWRTRPLSAFHVLWAVSSSIKSGRECRRNQAVVDNISVVEKVLDRGWRVSRSVYDFYVAVWPLEAIQKVQYAPALAMTAIFLCGGRPASAGHPKLSP